MDLLRTLYTICFFLFWIKSHFPTMLAYHSPPDLGQPQRAGVLVGWGGGQVQVVLHLLLQPVLSNQAGGRQSQEEKVCCESARRCFGKEGRDSTHRCLRRLDLRPISSMEADSGTQPWDLGLLCPRRPIHCLLGQVFWGAAGGVQEEQLLCSCCRSACYHQPQRR